MLEQSKIAPQTATEVLGELSALAEQLGSPELGGLTPGSAGLDLHRVRSLPELRQFLQDYATQVLISAELPAIYRAYQHASRSETRELIALDAALNLEPGLQGFSRASQHVGRSQLRKLRPLRDERVVQRYLAAVESGEAKGWHTIVFGLVAVFFSLPLRQGLLHYATQTLNGFIYSAAGRLQLSQSVCEKLLNETAQQLPQAVDEILKSETRTLRVTK